MDNLGKVAEYLEKVISTQDRLDKAASDRPLANSRAGVSVMALRLATAGVLALVDIAVSLRRVTQHLGYEEASDADNKI